MKGCIFFVVVIVLSALVVPCGFAGDHGHDEGHICFMRIDSNHDDKVTPEELKKFFPDDQTLFEKIDQDKDGSISHDEYEAYWYEQE